MNHEMRLARVDLGPGWIDLGYGEPVIIQQILHKHLNIAMKPSPLPEIGDLIHAPYQPPKGMKELVDFLEKKYKAQVVVTNGAKQGIAAVMYALRAKGHTSCTMHRPYWTSTPGLIASSGLNATYLDEASNSSRAMLITSPNNPDGKEITQEQMRELTADAKAQGVTLIHDAAYYSPIYTSQTPVENLGDVQIFSFAKLYGLSGLRIGYVVCRDESFVPLVTEFVERSCSGVSTASQHLALAVETHFDQNPELLASFQKECRDSIARSRAELTNIDPEVLQVETPTSNSMFCWAKTGPKFDAKAVKVNVIDGEAFGKPGYVRFNIAVDPDLIKSAVNRFNGRVDEQVSSVGVSEQSG